MATHFGLRLNSEDWKLLDEAAKRRGHNNICSFIRYGQLQLAASEKFKTHCEGMSKKRRNIYPIPEQSREFFENLACLHSTDVSTVIFRYVILPVLMSRRQVKDSPERWMVLPPMV